MANGCHVTDLRDALYLMCAATNSPWHLRAQRSMFDKIISLVLDSINIRTVYRYKYLHVRIHGAIAAAQLPRSDIGLTPSSSFNFSEQITLAVCSCRTACY